jgi:hypothetical protein
MATRNSKLEVLNKLQTMFGVPDEQLASFPEALLGLVRNAAAKRVLLTIEYNAGTGRVEKFMSSIVNPTAEDYQQVASVLMGLAQRLSQTALEVANNSGKDGKQEPQQ